MVPILSGSLIRGGVVRRALFLPPDVSISGVLKNLRLLKPGMSVERVISIANASGGFSGLKHAENLPVMDCYSVFMKEVNNRTKTIVMSERFPEKQKKVLSLLLAGHSWEYSAQFLKTGIRQIWLAEQSLKALGDTGQHVIAGSPAAEQQ